MTVSNKANAIFIPLLNEAIQGVFSGKNAFMGSPLASSGAVVVNGTFGGNKDAVKSQVQVPYFGTVGDFQDIATDGDALTPVSLGQTSELATVVHKGLAIEVSRWARSGDGGDLYTEGANQIMQSAQRAMDKQIIDVASASGALLLDVFSSTAPRKLDFDLTVDGRAKWGDEQDDIAALAVHSVVFADLLKQKSSDGVPLLTVPADGSLPRLCGVPVAVSDRLAITGSTMSAVTSAGTTPPTLTLSGTPLGKFDLKIICTVLGARGTWKFKFSTDGGENYSDEFTSAATVALTDTATDSLVGVNGKTGLTLAIATGNAAVDNVWTASSVMKFTSLLLKKMSLAFWYNKAALMLQTDRNILTDTDLAAMHLYSAPHRYRRYKGGSRSGVVRIVHN